MLCGLVGGPGLVSGGNFNTADGLAVFEQATRNAGRNIAGQNLANPTAYLVSTSKVTSYAFYYRVKLTSPCTHLLNKQDKSVIASLLARSCKFIERRIVKWLPMINDIFLTEK